MVLSGEKGRAEIHYAEISKTRMVVRGNYRPRFEKRI